MQVLRCCQGTFSVPWNACARIGKNCTAAVRLTGMFFRQTRPVVAGKLSVRGFRR